jgi:hypothetical protein
MIIHFINIRRGLRGNLGSPARVTKEDEEATGEPIKTLVRILKM